MHRQQFSFFYPFFLKLVKFQEVLDHFYCLLVRLVVLCVWCVQCTGCVARVLYTATQVTLLKHQERRIGAALTHTDAHKRDKI